MDKIVAPTLELTNASHPLAKSLRMWPGPSKIGAPLGIPANHAASCVHEVLDLDTHHPEAPSLSLACKALSSTLPAGMSLRGLGSYAGDRQIIYDHWIGLGVEGLRTRFFMTPSPWLLRQRAFDLDFENPRFAGIFDSSGVLACLAEWAYNGTKGTEAEAAFSTNPSYRRQGLAKIAAAACALDARANGIVTLRIDTLRENRAAQSLAASLGGAREISLTASLSDPLSSIIDLKAIGPSSIESRMGLRSAGARKSPA